MSTYRTVPTASAWHYAIDWRGGCSMIPCYITTNSPRRSASTWSASAGPWPIDWRKDAREAGAEVQLATEAVNRLEALRLVRRLENGVQALPALHRYAISEALT